MARMLLFINNKHACMHTYKDAGRLRSHSKMLIIHSACGCMKLMLALFKSAGAIYSARGNVQGAART